MPCPLPPAWKIARGDFSKCLRLVTGLGCAMTSSEAVRAPPERCPPRLPSATRPFPLLWEAGRGYRISLCFRRERAQRRAGEARDGRALGSARAGRSPVTPTRVPCSRPTASVPRHPLLAGQADSVRKRAMSPIVLPWNERVAAGKRVGGSVRSAAQGSRGRRGRPRPLRPAGSGRKWGHRGQLGEGLGWEVRVPHPVRPALPAGAAEAREGGGGQPDGGGRVQGGPTAGVGRFCRCKGAVVGPGPAPTRLWAAGSVHPLSLGTPPSCSPRPGAGGGGGAGGARPGRTCAPSRAGESPGEHVPWRAGGGESRERLHCCCCCRRGRRCLFLPPEPSPPRPGRGAPRAELSRARRSRRRAPQAAAAAAATVVAAARAGKLCPFVRAAPEAAGRSVQSVPFRLRGGGGAAGRHGGPGPGGRGRPGGRRGGRYLVAGDGAGVLWVTV